MEQLDTEEGQRLLMTTNGTGHAMKIASIWIILAQILVVKIQITNKRIRSIMGLVVAFKGLIGP
jgi:hypothetical protein